VSTRRASEQRESEPPAAGQAAPAEPTFAGLSESGILALQQTAGNQGVVRALAVARQAAAPTQTKIERLDELLDRSDVPEGEVIALLGTLSPAEKNTVLTGGYKAKLADPLTRQEMARAVNNLGFPLATKLEWVAAAAGGADELGYGDIKALVVAAPQDQRDALKSGAWRHFFTEVCTDATILQAVADLKYDLATKLDWIGGEYDLDDLGYAQIRNFIVNATQAERDVLKTRPWRDWFTEVCTDKTMATAVMDLGFDLKTKLAWMIYEDTNLELVGMVIRNTPAAELPAVAADAAFLKTLRDELGENDYKFAHAMLTQGLLGQATVDTDPSSFDIESTVALFRNGLVVQKEVEFSEKGKFAPGAFQTLKTRVGNDITTWLSGKFKVKIQSPGGAREGDGEYPITVRLIESSDADYTIRLHGGEHGRSSMGENRGDLYELGQASETSLPDITIAHESAHLMLGSDDEYADPDDPGRTVYTDNSLLGDYYAEGPAKAEIKARHFGFVVRTVARWFPGRAISIVK
jgi:hypothetical protein